MKLELVTEFPQEEIDYLWSVGVNMDDWNFAIIGEPNILMLRYKEGGKIELQVKDYKLEMILQCAGYDYKCYLVDFRGKKCAICVQYH